MPWSHFSISCPSVWASSLRDAIGPEREWQIVVRALAARNGWVGHCLEGLCDPIGRAGDFRLIAAKFQTIAEGQEQGPFALQRL